MKTERSKNLYKVMERFAELTKAFVQRGEMKRAEKCLRIADKLLTTGNFIIQNAVANVYVYSLSSLLDQRDEKGKQLMSILPSSLRREYEHQVDSLGV